MTTTTAPNSRRWLLLLGGLAVLGCVGLLCIGGCAAFALSRAGDGIGSSAFTTPASSLPSGGLSVQSTAVPTLARPGTGSAPGVAVGTLQPMPSPAPGGLAVGTLQPKPSPGAGGVAVQTPGSTAGAGISWVHTIGRSDDEAGLGAIGATRDGGYIVAGRNEFYNPSNGTGQFWVLKLNRDGTLAWSQSLAPGNASVANAVAQVGDGDYVVAGQDGTEAWAVKLDANGKVLWQRLFGGGHADLVSAIAATPDNGVIIAGSSNSFSPKYKAWLFKVDANGDVAWSKTYGGDGDDSANAIAATSDGYIVAGDSTSGKAGKYAGWVFKLDPDGKLVWSKTLGGANDDHATGVAPVSDGFVVAGYTTSAGAGGSDAWVFKLDLRGNLLWSKTYGGPQDDLLSAVAAVPGGAVVATGTTSSFGANRHLWALGLNADGTAAWQMRYGGAQSDSGDAVAAAGDGSFIIAGTTNSFSGSRKADEGWVLKLGANGALAGCTIGTPTTATVANTNFPLANGPTASDSQDLTPDDTTATSTKVTIQSGAPCGK